MPIYHYGGVGLLVVSHDKRKNVALLFFCQAVVSGIFVESLAGVLPDVGDDAIDAGEISGVEMRGGGFWEGKLGVVLA